MSVLLIFVFPKFATELWPLIDVRIWFLINILRTNSQYKTKFCINITIDKIYVGIVNSCFSQICNRVTALDSCHSLVFTQFLENELTNVSKFCIGITIDKIYICDINHDFPQICNRVSRRWF